MDSQQTVCHDSLGGLSTDALTVLIVRGLSYSSTEDSIGLAFSPYVRPKEIRLMRDRATGESRGFCFLDFHTVDVSKLP